MTGLVYVAHIASIEIVAHSVMKNSWTALNQNGLIEYLSMAHFLTGLLLVAICYAAGQWASMHIRSGLVAGAVGLLMAAGLWFWCGLMSRLEIGLWWSVMPIPVLLLLATWLRTPDWIRENTRWRARIQAAAAVIAPALILAFFVVAYRVYSVRLVSPGFDADEYLAHISPEAKETAELYRQIEHLANFPDGPAFDGTGPRDFDPNGVEELKLEKQWVESNAAQLKQALEASRRGSCALVDPKTLTIEGVDEPSGLIELVTSSARVLQADGKLDESLDHYLAAIHMASQFSAVCAGTTGQISYWLCKKHHRRTS